MRIVGESISRIDAVSKVTGQAQYPGDINRPDQVYMKILYADRPHAIVHNLDLTDAQRIPGVLDILTSSDVPANEFGLVMMDQPVLCGPSAKQFADRVRFIGDKVACVVAESERIAVEACRKIKVTYEDLPIVTDPLKALAADAPRLHPERDSNVFSRYRIRKGNVEEAFRRADVVIEGVYDTPAQEHAYLQPEAGVSYVDEEGRITVVVAGQWVHEDQEQIAHALNLPLEKIRVIYPAIGGAFGGREDMSVQIVLALAAWRLHQKGIERAVKIIWSREESLIAHHKRHPFHIKAKWGATRDGKIIAAEMNLVADGGAYALTSTKVLGNATILCTGPYEIPNIKVDTCAVYTNNISAGAFRGFGGPQAAFAAEMQISKLAEALGIDAVEVRRRNLLQEGSLLSVGTPLPKGVSIGQVVEQCALSAGWIQAECWQRKQDSNLEGESVFKKGTGFACSFKNIGFSFGAPEQCTAKIELRGSTDIEEALVYHSGAEVGQGTHTIMAQMAAEALSIPLSKVRMIVSDTAVTPPSGSASASRMTFMAGNSIRGAAQLALEKWHREERPAVAEYQYRPPKTTPMDPETGKAEPNFAYGYVAEAVDVEVDTETGEIKIKKVICADDVGCAINPQQVQGQIEGSVVQAAGYTVLENFIQKDGRVLTKHLSTYLIPTILDIPDEVQSILVETPDPNGPWGARGMGEMPYLPFAPAVIDAVHDATGVWFDEFPLTPERILRGLGKLGKR